MRGQSVAYHIYFYGYGNLGTKRAHDILRGAELAGVRAGIGTQAVSDS